MTEAAVTAPEPLAERGATVAAGAEEVIVLDYGGQYSQLIARRVRDCGVFSELLPHHVPLEEIARRKPRGIILSGGPASVYAEGAPPLERGLLDVPPRHRLRAAAGLHGAGLLEQLAGSSCGERRAGHLRHPVPPGGGAH